MHMKLTLKRIETELKWAKSNSEIDLKTSVEPPTKCLIMTENQNNMVIQVV